MPTLDTYALDTTELDRDTAYRLSTALTRIPIFESDDFLLDSTTEPEYTKHLPPETR